MAGDPNPRRIWSAIGIGTFLQAIATGSLIFAILATQSTTPESAGPFFALGFMLVPVVFATVAFLSGQANAPIATLKAMGLWAIIALPLGLVNPVMGLCAGFTAGAAVTMRATPEIPGRARMYAVLLATGYVTTLLLILPQAGVFAGAVTPLLAVKAADYYTEKKTGSTTDG